MITKDLSIIWRSNKVPTTGSVTISSISFVNRSLKIRSSRKKAILNLTPIKKMFLERVEKRRKSGFHSSQNAQLEAETAG